MSSQRGRSPLARAVAGLALLSVAALTGCSPDKGIKSREVHRDEFGSQWPFSADSGVLACEFGVTPTFTDSGKTVGLEEPDFDRWKVWASDATEAQAGVMREEAMTLCD